MKFIFGIFIPFVLICGLAKTEAFIVKEATAQLSTEHNKEGISGDNADVELFHRIPAYPGSFLVHADESKKTVIYQSDARAKNIFSFYIQEMEERNPPRNKDHLRSFIRTKQMTCTIRWHYFEFKDVLYIIKNQMALTIRVSDGCITYQGIDCRRAWDEIVKRAEESEDILVEKDTVPFFQHIPLYPGALLIHADESKKKVVYQSDADITDVFPFYKKEMERWKSIGRKDNGENGTRKSRMGCGIRWQNHEYKNALYIFMKKMALTISVSEGSIIYQGIDRNQARAALLALDKSDADPSEENSSIQFFPRIPAYPDATLVHADESEKTVIYQSDADRIDVFSFYRRELEKRNPPRKKHFGQSLITAKQMHCNVRWHCFECKDVLYIIKDQMALTLRVSDGSITYRGIDRNQAWAETCILDKKNYFKKVYTFARKVRDSYSTPEQEREELEKIGLLLYCTFERLQEYTRIYALDLMKHLQDNPKWKRKGLIPFLAKIGYWEYLTEAVKNYININTKHDNKFIIQYEIFKKEWSNE
ncbi:MAG: hypothetical protein ACMUIP_04125 [bacterium]